MNRLIHFAAISNNLLWRNLTLITTSPLHQLLPLTVIADPLLFPVSKDGLLLQQEFLMFFGNGHCYFHRRNGDLPLFSAAVRSDLYTEEFLMFTVIFRTGGGGQSWKGR